MASAHRAASHERTLGLLFEHPMSFNIEWPDVVALFEALGTASEGTHDSLHVTVNNQTVVLHRPNNKSLGADEITQIRHFLLRAGIEAPHPAKGPNSGGTG